MREEYAPRANGKRPENWPGWISDNQSEATISPAFDTDNPKLRLGHMNEEIVEFKNFLGPIAKQYNDAQLRQLRREMRQMAELLLDIYLYRKRSNDSSERFDGFSSEA
jgi:hypothetical protein